MANVYIDSQQGQTGFVVLESDNLSGQTGFVVVESFKFEGQTSFYLINFSFLTDELAIETCQVRNKDRFSVTLVGRIVDFDGNSSVNVFFEYWKKSDPSQVFVTPEQTISSSETQPVYVFQDIEGLEEVTDYEYRAIVYVDPNDKKGGGIVPFTTAGIRYISFDETWSVYDTEFKTFERFDNEYSTISDSFRLWDVWAVKSFEILSTSDSYYNTFMYYKDENLLCTENYFNLFLSRYDEKVRSVEEKRYKEPYPIKWYIGKPINSNFSFESDTDGNGIADGWYYENVDLKESFIGWHGLKPTVQFVKFRNKGRLYTKINAEGFLHIFFEIKPAKNLSFRIYDEDTGEIYYQKVFRNDEDFILEKFSTNVNTNLILEFFGSNLEFYLDNFAIVKEKSLTGFTYFGYNIKGKEFMSSFGRKYENERVLTKEFALGWNWITRKELEKLKNMIGSKILVVSPLEETFAFILLGWDSEVLTVKPGQEWEQKYRVSLKVQEV